MTIEVLDQAGSVVRTYSSEDPVPDPAPALDPAAYDKLCQQRPTAPDCRPAALLAGAADRRLARAGMHRISLGHALPAARRGARSAGRRRRPFRGGTHAPATAPWAPPGDYTVG